MTNQIIVLFDVMLVSTVAKHMQDWASLTSHSLRPFHLANPSLVPRPFFLSRKTRPGNEARHLQITRTGNEARLLVDRTTRERIQHGRGESSEFAASAQPRSNMYVASMVEVTGNV